MTHSDVLIMGGGIIGLAIARELALRGVTVTILERHQPGREASWAGAGMLAPQGELSEGDFLRLCLESNRLYPQFSAAVEAETGTCCYHREAGTLAVALTGDDEAELRATHARQIADGLRAEWLSGDAARHMEPSLGPATRAAMHLPGDRHIENRLLVPALEQACRKLGVAIVCGAQVDGIVADAQGVAGADTVLGVFHSRCVINAAGSWAGQIGVPDAALRPPVVPVLGQMLALALPSPTFLNRVVRSPRAYLVPRHDGRLFVGATMERVGFDKRNTASGIRKLLAGAVELLPGLENSVIQDMWSGLRPGTPDNHPILGATKLPGYLMATGTFRNGFLLTPVIAQALADLVTTGTTPEIIAPFGLERFAGRDVVAGRVPGA